MYGVRVYHFAKDLQETTEIVSTHWTFYEAAKATPAGCRHFFEECPYRTPAEWAKNEVPPPPGLDVRPSWDDYTDQELADWLASWTERGMGNAVTVIELPDPPRPFPEDRLERLVRIALPRLEDVVVRFGEEVEYQLNDSPFLHDEEAEAEWLADRLAVSRAVRLLALLRGEV